MRKRFDLCREVFDGDDFVIGKKGVRQGHWIEGPGEPDLTCHVGRGRLRIEAVEEPEALLRERYGRTARA